MENPKLLKCIYFKNELFSTQDKRIVKDYEFDLYLEGGRTIYINNKKYNIEPHNLVFRKPGDIVCGEGTFDCYMLTLDLSNNSSDSDYSRNKLGMQQPLTQNYLLSALSPVFTPLQINRYQELLRILSMNVLDKNPDVLSPIIMEFLCIIAASAYHNLSKNIVEHDFSHICGYIQKNYNENITTEELAKTANLDKSYFIRKFKKTLGVTPMQYFFHIRINNAKILLLNTNLAINEIAEQCGFCDASYFTLLFKKSFKITPKEYRANKNSSYNNNP